MERKGYKKGGKAEAADAVHKHEKALHKGEKLTPMKKGGAVKAGAGSGVGRLQKAKKAD